MLKIAWSPIYAHPLPKGHRFPMIKYDLLPQQLLHEGTINKENLFEPKPLSEELILLTHNKAYWEKLKNQNLSKAEIRRTGFPLSKELIEREIIIAQGTVDAANYALQFGAAMNIAGGTHHAFTDRGEGFCLLNDIAIASNYLLSTNKVDQILVVDLDVHQGNGTAEIFKNEKRVFTFSMHGANNYPLEKEKSNLDIGLPDKIEDDEYLSILNNRLPQLIESIEPDIIFFQAGVDVLKQDKLGRLNLTIEGCKKRDEFVIQNCFNNNIPLVVSMGGGYAPEIKDIIEAHANTYRSICNIIF